MKILFLIFHGFSDHSGISKKIHYQVNGLKEAGHEVHLCYYTITAEGYRKRIINKETIEDYGYNKFAPIKKRISFKTIHRYVIKNKIELIYMRSDNNANPFITYFLYKLKKQNVKTIMEIPTYPYDHEYKGFPLKYKLELFTDKCFRTLQAKQLFRICTFSEEESIFGVKTIKISNGIDFNQIKLKAENKKHTSFNLIGVAEVHYWHGFDRVLKGLGEYYKQSRNQDVYFHIVGGIGSSEMSTFNSIIQEYKINNFIIFHGQLFGEKLDNVFEQANFGIGSLARHRSQITHIKTLKNREYAARGLSFIYSETDFDFEDKPYIIKAPADESPIDIQRILSFYNQQIFTPQEIRNSITDLSWKTQMQKVVDEVINNK